LNAAKGRRSRFLRFEDGARLEPVNSEALVEGGSYCRPTPGYAHRATGSVGAVHPLTARLSAAGRPSTNGPGSADDGYFRSTVLDPECNPVEITG